MQQYLILVDENDQPVGKLEKLMVHQRGLLHRAFSVFIFNSKGELLLQQRAASKYHSGGLWTNTCCSHPLYGEKLADSIERRLAEEMGMKCNVQFVFHFIYRIQFENGLTENEFDHVYFGISDAIPSVNPDEVQAWKYISLDALKNEIDKNPQLYSAWLKICLPEVEIHASQFLL